ncbi:hypothetical protein V8F20_005134 [Naviculisporaceae sp. PSN 640]
MAFSLRGLLVTAASTLIVVKSVIAIDVSISQPTNNKDLEIDAAKTDAVKLNAFPNDAVEVATVGLTTVTIFASGDSSAVVLTDESTSSAGPAGHLPSVSLPETAPTIANVTASPVPTTFANITTITPAVNKTTSSPTSLNDPTTSSIISPKPTPDDSKPDEKESGAGKLALLLKHDLLATIILVGVLFSLAMYELEDYTRYISILGWA